MSHQRILEANSPTGAGLTKTRAIAVTSTSANVDLTTLTEVGSDISAGRMIRLRADGADIYYAFGSAGAGTIDDTNTTAANATQCDVIPAGQFIDVRCPRVTPTAGQPTAWTFLYYKTASGQTGKLRISVSSQDPSNEYI